MKWTTCIGARLTSEEDKMLRVELERPLLERRRPVLREFIRCAVIPSFRSDLAGERNESGQTS